MSDFTDERLKKVERQLSKLGALVALAAEDAAIAKQRADDAERRMVQAGQEIEQLYTTLTEPLLLTMEQAKSNRRPKNGVQKGCKPASAKQKK